ncbi:MAG: GNAT family N-acetyltransferase [Nocardioides sp.]
MAGPREDVLIRPATAADAAAMGDVHVDSREANVGSMPAMVNTRDETHTWMAHRLAGESEGWVAEVGGRVVGYLVLTHDWVDDLFLLPEATGRGIGAALLDLVKAQRPDGFRLWAFESNRGARRFYARHGLVELERTDGSGNNEKAPDVKMAWPGADPLGYLRRLVDDVDAELGDLLARRTALTRVIQSQKDETARDPEREAEITAAMARRAPGLGEERLARIVHVIISESLDAARARQRSAEITK